MPERTTNINVRDTPPLRVQACPPCPLAVTSPQLNDPPPRCAGFYRFSQRRTCSPASNAHSMYTNHRYGCRVRASTQPSPGVLQRPIWMLAPPTKNTITLVVRAINNFPRSSSSWIERLSDKTGFWRVSSRHGKDLPRVPPTLGKHSGYAALGSTCRSGDSEAFGIRCDWSLTQPRKPNTSPYRCQ